MSDAIDGILAEVRAELHHATAKFAPMVSDREGFDVIDEEVDELKLAIRWGVDHRGNPANPRDEAIQLAAMAVRFIYDVSDREAKP